MKKLKEVADGYGKYKLIKADILGTQPWKSTELYKSLISPAAKKFRDFALNYVEDIVAQKGVVV